MVLAFVVSAALITLAELGDKTQLLVLCLAARYSTRQVLAGVFGAALLLMFIATAAGRLAGELIPRSGLSVVAGLLFVGFGVWTLLSASRGSAEGDEEFDTRSRAGPMMTTAVAFFLAELGDKTQIMAMAIAADPGAALRTAGLTGLVTRAPEGAAAFLGVWLGSAAGMMLADGLAIALGSYLGKRLPERLIRTVSGVIFVLFGIATLVAGLR